MSRRILSRNCRLARLGIVLGAGLLLTHVPTAAAQSQAVVQAPAVTSRVAPQRPTAAPPSVSALPPTAPAVGAPVGTATPASTPAPAPTPTAVPAPPVPAGSDSQLPTGTDAEPPPSGFTPVPATPDGNQGQDACLSDAHCNELYERARSLSRVGQYEASLIMYQQTYALNPLPWLLLNIGRVQQKLGRNDQAAISFRRLLNFNAKLPTDETTGLADPEVLAKARQYLAEAEQSIVEKQAAAAAIVTASPREPVAVRTPVYQRWWFWAAVSGGLGLTALGIGLGYGLSTSSSAPRVPGGIDILYPAF